MIGGVLKPQRGRIRIDDASPDAQRNIGALLDHTGLYQRLTARENIAYFGHLRGIPTARLKDRIEELLSILGLQSIADRRTAGFSQGERMKTALARAIIHAPKNLLLDEPTNGLDVMTVRSLRTFLKQARDSGHCIVFSSHVELGISTACRTAKEAHTYLSMLAFVPMMVGMFLVFHPQAADSWAHFLPIAGQQWQLERWAHGGGMPLVQALVLAVLTAAAAACAVLAAANVMERDDVVYGNG
jgi:ABC-type lipoprotein export system ATPase subunit